MEALNERFGQPHLLALQKINTIMDSSDIHSGDTTAFDRFALRIQALVGLLRTLGQEGETELQCGSHVARLLTKLPPEMRSNFGRHMGRQMGSVYTLLDLAEWLKFESWCQDHEIPIKGKGQWDKPMQRYDGQKDSRNKPKHATVLHAANLPPVALTPEQPPTPPVANMKRAYCPYCDSKDHFLGQCPGFLLLDKKQITSWIQQNKRCWRCGRLHQAAQCTLRRPCSICRKRHLQVLHEINQGEPERGHPLVEFHI